MASDKGDKQEIQRNNRGQFAKGQSGNPAGAAPGPNWNERVRNAAGQYAVDVMHEVGRAALDGDMTAAKIILDRTSAPLKPAHEKVSIASIDGSLADKADVIMKAASNGDLPPDVANQLVTGLTGLAKIREVDELERRIQQLEGGKDDDKNK